MVEVAVTHDDAVQPRVVCVIAASRTGSNLLCNALENIPGARSVLEVFHPRWVARLDATELAAFAARAGGPDAMTRWRSAHPGQVLDMLLDPGPPGPLVIKVFPKHVACRLVRGKILPRSDTAFVVLTRRPIESFISTTKASLLRKYHTVDTTSLRPAIDARSFANWARQRRRWYRWVDICLERHAIEPVRLSYDHDLAPDPVRAAGKVAARFGFPFDPTRCPLVRRRQDLETDFRLRVENWDAFAANADPELLAWATATPPDHAAGSMDS